MTFCTFIRYAQSQIIKKKEFDGKKTNWPPHDNQSPTNSCMLHENLYVTLFKFTYLLLFISGSL
jgi:hypothetical protein